MKNLFKKLFKRNKNKKTISSGSLSDLMFKARILSELGWEVEKPVYISLTNKFKIKFIKKEI